MSRKIATFRRRLARLGPYVSLAIVLIPLAIVEPLKLIALVIAGEGHWLTGTTVLLLAYAFSLLVLERLFALLKPNLMRLQWVRGAWIRWRGARHKALSWISRRGGIRPISARALRRAPGAAVTPQHRVGEPERQQNH